MESGLLSLKAELHKHKVEANKRPLDELYKTTKKLFAKEPKIIKKHETQDVTNDDQKDDKNLKKSREALLQKAALYDRIKNGTEVLEDDELNQRYLIDFQEKINNEVAEVKRMRENKRTEEANEKLNPGAYKAKDPTEEWVEYKDSFGRTRTCMKKDVDHIKDQVKVSFQNDTGISRKIKEKWDKIEEHSKSKSEIHYQDVLFDEARSHGAGFMSFSRDEEKRAAQQQYLKDLGAQTEKVKVSKEALKAKRERLMKERLAKVRQKKRLKMGLPVNDEEKYKTPPPSDEEDNSIDVDTKDEDMPCEINEEHLVEKEIHVREWDIGKPGVNALLTQEQWIETRRKCRDNEFAPPTDYQNVNNVPRRSKSKDSNSVQKESNAEINVKRAERPSDFAPPSTYEYYGPSVVKRKNYPNKIDLEAAIEKGLSEIRKTQSSSGKIT